MLNHQKKLSMKNTLKGIAFFASFLLLISIIFVSCKKDEGEVSQENISGKWEVSNPQTAGYRSFEFNKFGNYIVTKSNLTVKFGNYTIDNQKINLIDLGTISSKTLSKESFSFEFTPKDATAPIVIETTKAEEMEASSRTELLCRTWELYSIDGQVVAGTGEELTVLFSAAGTYLVTQESYSGTAQWKWKDSQEQVFCYSWEGEPVCMGENEVTITKLTSSELSITEDETVYVLVPYTVKRGAVGTPGSAPLNAAKVFGR